MLALTEGLAEQAAVENVISITFLSIGQGAGKTKLDKILTVQKATKFLQNLLDRSGQAFVLKKKGIVDRFPFYPQKQEFKDSLERFRQLLNRLDVKCEFRGHTKSRVYDIFSLNSYNGEWELSCTQQKTAPTKHCSWPSCLNQDWVDKLDMEEKIDNTSSNKLSTITDKVVLMTNEIGLALIKMRSKIQSKYRIWCNGYHFHNDKCEGNSPHGLTFRKTLITVRKSSGLKSTTRIYPWSYWCAANIWKTTI